MIRCALVLVGVSLFAQNGGAVHGVVRDAKDQPVASAAVQLTTGAQTINAVTNSQGVYRFHALAPGSYTVHMGQTNIGPFALRKGEDKAVDLTLDKPQFYDEPSFIVAGVTDPSLRGGHGADPVYHSAETLTKATTSLRTNVASHADEEEKRGDALNAAREYQRAAELDPSEANLFDWGVELLKHRALAQAGEVLDRGHRLYPRSTRMLLGLAVSLYSRGSYDRAATLFFEAADLNPADPTPYLFLGRLANGSITEAPGYAERMQRFARLLPENAWANYYYAACLWKRRENPEKAQALLEKAIQQDSHLAAALLLLGTIQSEQNKLAEAAASYQKAIASDPGLEEAHYRLAQAWRRLGQPDKSREEIEVYRKLSDESAQNAERERAGIQEFVFSLRH